MPNADGVNEQVYESRPQEDIDRITAIVRNAVGYDSQRNDQIEVVNLPFDRTAIEVEQQKLDTIVQRDFYFDIGKKVIYFLLAILAILYIRKLLKKAFASLGRILPPSSGARVARYPSGGYSPQGAVEDEEVPPIVMESRKPKLVDQMQAAAKGKPEEIAKVIKTMMIE
jgi:flagellar biosynthesis/type III secretory pathway M-ring protein FliF/YscJ